MAPPQSGRARSAFPFNLKKMSASGALFDTDKLNDVSKTVISRMDAGAVTDAVIAWAAEYAPEFHALLVRDRDYARGVFAIDRGGNKPRKDLANGPTRRTTLLILFDETFTVCPTAALPETIAPADAKAVLAAYRNVYDPAQDKQAWFQTIKELCPSLGFCPRGEGVQKESGGLERPCRRCQHHPAGGGDRADNTPTCAASCSCWGRRGYWPASAARGGRTGLRLAGFNG